MYPPPHFRDSYASPDSESVYFKPPKQTAGPEFYNRSNRNRQFNLMGVGAATVVGLSYIVGGTLMFRSKRSISWGIVLFPQVPSYMVMGLLSLALNLVVTLCTEATGLVHGIALRSALASEKRLHFNTNLRLLSAASGFFNPNGTFWNIIMAILLIVSYSSSPLIALCAKSVSPSGDVDYILYLCEVPLLVLGVTLLSQAVIALVCVWAAGTKILTWSSSPFDLTAALIHQTWITPDPGRCMRSVCDNNQRGPVTPSPKQPSAWRAHPSIRKVVLTLWTFVAVYFAWALIMTYLSGHHKSRAIQSWSFLQRLLSNYVVLTIPLARTSGVNWNWTLYYVNMAVIHGPLALVLHYSELIVNVMRDERMWRKATSKKGITISSNPLASVCRSPLKLAFLLMKPLLHSLLGHTTTLTGMADDRFLTSITMSMWPVQILIYTAALLVATVIFTTMVFRRPEGPQPAAYGHIQTLANLIDEWSPTMWWGDKEDGSPFRHAGTSDHPLPEVNMNAMYG